MKPKQTRDVASFFLKKRQFFGANFSGKSALAGTASVANCLWGGWKSRVRIFPALSRESLAVLRNSRLCAAAESDPCHQTRETVPTVSSLSSSSFSIPGGKYWHGFGRWRWTMKGTDIRQLVKGLYKLAKMRQPLHGPTKIFQELVKLVNVTLNLYSSASPACSPQQGTILRDALFVHSGLFPLSFCCSESYAS